MHNQTFTLQEDRQWDLYRVDVLLPRPDPPYVNALAIGAWMDTGALACQSLLNVLRALPPEFKPMKDRTVAPPGVFRYVQGQGWPCSVCRGYFLVRDWRFM